MATNKQVEQGEANSEQTAKHHRRWPYVILGIVIGVAGVALLLPTLLSTRIGTGYLASWVNSQFKGSIQVNDLATSWRGPTAITGVQVRDPEGRKVLEARNVRWAKGLWGALTSAVEFQDLTLDSPKAALYFDDSGTPSIARTVDSRTPSPPPATPGDLPRPVGRLTIKGGDVLLVRPNGTRLTITALDANLNVNTLSNIEGSIGLQMPEGGRILSDFNIHHLADQTDFTPDEAQGRLTLNTEGTIQVAPLARFALDDNHTAGQASLKLTADFQPDNLITDFDARVAGLRSSRIETDQVRPLDLAAIGRLRTTPDNITTQATLESQAGRVVADLIYVKSKQPIDLTRDKLAGLILHGDPAPLPEFTLRSHGTVDIPTLARAVPALLTLRPGVEIQRGSFQIQDVLIQGGSRPRAAGTVQLTQVAAQRGDQGLQLPPIVTDFDAFIQEGRGLAFRRGRLQSAFLNVNVQGALSDLNAGFEGNLAQINQFGQVFELFSVDAVGTLHGRLNLNRNTQDVLAIDLDMTARDFRYAGVQGAFATRQAHVTFDGILPTANHRVRRVDIRQARVDLDNQLRADGAGWYDRNHGGFHAEVNIPQADLGYAMQKVGEWRGTPPTALGGTARLRLTVGRTAGQAPLAVAGNGRIDRFAAGVGPDRFEEPQITFAARQVLVDDWEQQVTIEQAMVKSSLASVRTSGMIREYRTRRLLDFKGNYEAALNRVTALIHRMAPATVQTVAFRGRSAGRFTVTGPAGTPIIQGLDVGTGVNWASGDVYGLMLTPASVPLQLQHGQLLLPSQSIGASEGTVQLGGLIDFGAHPPTLRISDPLPVLNRIRLNKKFGVNVLSRINPIFVDVLELDGHASLSVQNVDVPLSNAIETSGTGRGRLDLTEMKIVPGGVLGGLMRFGSLPGQKLYTMTVSGADLEFRNGRIYYQNLRVALGMAYDMIFSGSVGFDDTLDLMVSLPLRPALLKHFNIRPQVMDMISPTRGLRIIVPLGGTRQNPKLDFSAVNIREILRQELKGTLLRPGRTIDELLAPLRPGQSLQQRGRELLKPLIPGLRGPEPTPGPFERGLENLLDPFKQDRNNQDGSYI